MTPWEAAAIIVLGGMAVASLILGAKFRIPEEPIQRVHETPEETDP